MERRSDRVASRAIQPDAVGLAAVEAEGELVAVGLQVLWLHRAGMRAEHASASGVTPSSGSPAGGRPRAAPVWSG
jgi:hypothetical protein